MSFSHGLQHSSRSNGGSSDFSISESRTTNSSPPCLLTVSALRTQLTDRYEID